MTEDIDIRTVDSGEVEQLKEAEKSSTTMVNSPHELDARVDANEVTEKGGKPGWIAGVVMIVTGIVFLIANFTNFELNNWWALFILIPAFSSLGNAFRVYQRDGRLGHEGRGSLVGGMILTFVSAAFLFSWNWGTIWPYFLIIGGIGLLLNALLD